jgi:hypothetical protein
MPTRLSYHLSFKDEVQKGYAENVPGGLKRIYANKIEMKI